MKNISMSIVYLFDKDFILLKIKVALIDCSWSKVLRTKAASNNRPMASITAQLGVARPDWVKKKLGQLPREVIPSRGSLADAMFSHVAAVYHRAWFIRQLTTSDEQDSEVDVKSITNTSGTSEAFK